MVDLEFHTNDSFKVDLAKRYWAMSEDGAFKENVADLLPIEGVTSSSKLAAYIREIATARDKNQVCLECGFCCVVGSRAAAAKYPVKARITCDACKQLAENDRKKQWEKANDALNQRLTEMINNLPTKVVDYAHLPDDVALILIALERAINPRLFTGTFMRGDCHQMAPLYTGDLIRKLYHAGAITDDPSKAKPGAYFLKDDLVWHYSDQVAYFLVKDKSIPLREDAFQLLADRDFVGHRAIRNLWLDYAVSDCMAYFFAQCALHNLDTSDEDNAEIVSTLRNALQTYSVAQLWSVLWKVVRDAASLAMRDYYNNAKAAATLPGKVMRYLESVAKDRAAMKQWTRPHNQPAGTLGQVFGEYFSIDENTPGMVVMEMFADRENNSKHIHADQETAKQAEAFLACALEQNECLNALEAFADAIRSGLDLSAAIAQAHEIVAS